MKLLKLYEAIYAVLYEFSLGKWCGDNDMASFFTASALGGASGSNLLTGIALALAFTNIREWMPHWILVGGPASIVIAHYVFFLPGKRYEHIVERFSVIPIMRRRRFSVAAWTYLLVSYSAALGVIIILSERLQGP